jgi:hypothetical protein
MPKTVKITTEVYCTVLLEGLHYWPDCHINEVSYLKDPHRHVFHVKAFKKVSHDNRDVEFIVLKHEIESYFYDKYFNSTVRLFDFGPKSCEMLAKEIISKFDLSRCEVSEDGENGAIVSVHGTVTDGGHIIS